MMRIRRAVVVVLDGLRPDAIGRFDMTHLRRLAHRGAATMAASTVSPSVTAAAMASLLTGTTPQRHGVTTDQFQLPRPLDPVDPLPRLLSAAGLPTSAFVRDLPLRARGVAARIVRRLGVSAATFGGRNAPEILMAARGALRSQRRGLIFLHWPDADQAGHESGWMSPRYGDAARRLDATLGLLAALAGVPSDPETLLVALSDHGGGGTRERAHDSPHPLDRTIPIVLAGGAVSCGELAPLSSLLDVPATVLWALGLPVPESYAGRPLVEAFAPGLTPEGAVVA